MLVCLQGKGVLQRGPSAVRRSWRRRHTNVRAQWLWPQGRVTGPSAAAGDRAGATPTCVVTCHKVVGTGRLTCSACRGPAPAGSTCCAWPPCGAGVADGQHDPGSTRPRRAGGHRRSFARRAWCQQGPRSVQGSLPCGSMGLVVGPAAQHGRARVRVLELVCVLPHVAHQVLDPKGRVAARREGADLWRARERVPRVRCRAAGLVLCRAPRVKAAVPARLSGRRVRWRSRSSWSASCASPVARTCGAASRSAAVSWPAGSSRVDRVRAMQAVVRI